MVVQASTNDCAGGVILDRRGDGGVVDCDGATIEDGTTTSGGGIIEIQNVGSPGSGKLDSGSHRDLDRQRRASG